MSDQIDHAKDQAEHEALMGRIDREIARYKKHITNLKALLAKLNAEEGNTPCQP